MKKIKRKIKYWGGVIIIGIMLGISIQFVVAWTEPSLDPPTSNLLAPINISNNSQYKEGSLYLNSSGAYVNGLIVRNNAIIRNLNGGTTSLYVGYNHATGNNSNDGRIILFGEHNNHIYTATITQGSSNLFISTPGHVMSSSPLDIVSGNQLLVRSSSNNNIGYIRHNGSNFQLYTNHGNIQIGDNNDNVGIGTSSPSKKLDVAGAVKGDQLCIGSDCRSSWPTPGGSGKLIRNIRYSNRITVVRNTYNVDAGYVYCHSDEILVNCAYYSGNLNRIVTYSDINVNSAYYYDKYPNSNWERDNVLQVRMTPDHNGCYIHYCDDDPYHKFNNYYLWTVAICLRVQ